MRGPGTGVSHRTPPAQSPAAGPTAEAAAMTSPVSLNRSASWDQRSLSTMSFSSQDEFSLSWANNPSPPWAVEDERSSVSRSSLQSRGFRDGGPKEARLKRVAFLSLEKDVSGTYPVKVEHLPPKTSPDKLRDQFKKQFDDIRDVYVPMSPQKNQPVADFAIVRFGSPEAAKRACQSPSSELGGLSVSPLSKQRSFFSRGTGYHGIHNEPVEDGTYVRGMQPVQQDISLESCMSRAGYPWGSFRELKFLEPHIPTEARETFAVRIDNLDRRVTDHELASYFRRYGEVAAARCPKPLIIKDRISDPNSGFAFVRFNDRRDAEAACKDIDAGNVSFNGRVVKGKVLNPSFWPTDQTRRYY